MKTIAINPIEEWAPGPTWFPGQTSTCRSSYLHLINGHDLESLREEIAAGSVPPDLEAKLETLANGDLGHRFIEQNCRTMLALLLAIYQDGFAQANPAQRRRMLEVLAYVRKDDDAIPDYRPDGFVDDQQEVRAAATELGPLLQAFKAWRLRHQVPALWLNHEPVCPSRIAVPRYKT